MKMIYCSFPVNYCRRKTIQLILLRNLAKDLLMGSVLQVITVIVALGIGGFNLSVLICQSLVYLSNGIRKVLVVFSRIFTV
jgi:hypothetical protein